MSDIASHPSPLELDPTEFKFHPVTPKNWPDLEVLFSERGVQKGCWCMYWREPRTDFSKNYGAGNKHALQNITDSGTVPGILAYYKKEPAGWCSVAPREDFSVLARSPTLKPVDEEAVWSIVCFFISKPFRGAGLSHLLIQAAVQYARDHGAHIVEAYPIEPNAKSIEGERYTGLTTTFLKAGFQEVLRRSDRRPIMRYRIE